MQNTTYSFTNGDGALEGGGGGGRGERNLAPVSTVIVKRFACKNACNFYGLFVCLSKALSILCAYSDF